MKKLGIFLVILFALVTFYITGCKGNVEVDVTPPAEVTNLTATSEEGKIILTWEDPSDSDLLGIKVYDGKAQTARAVSLEDGILVGKGIQKCEICNLEDGKIYTFKVSAVDKSLNESAAKTTTPVTFKVQVVEKAVYVCPKDKKEFATAEEAANCCGVQTVEKEVTVYKYICPKDKKEFATAQEAADCCGVQIEYVDKEVEKIVKKYVCPRDGKEFDTKDAAENCCANNLNGLRLFSVTTDDTGKETKTLKYIFGIETFDTGSFSPNFTYNYSVDFENNTLSKNYKMIRDYTPEEFIEDKLERYEYINNEKMVNNYKTLLNYQLTRKTLYSFDLDEETNQFSLTPIPAPFDEGYTNGYYSYTRPESEISADFNGITSIDIEFKDKITLVPSSKRPQGMFIYTTQRTDDSVNQRFSLLYSCTSENTFEGELYMGPNYGFEIGLKVAKVTGNWQQSQDLNNLSLQITNVEQLDFSEENKGINSSMTYEERYDWYGKSLFLLKTDSPITLTWNTPATETYDFIKVK